MLCPVPCCVMRLRVWSFVFVFVFHVWWPCGLLVSWQEASMASDASVASDSDMSQTRGLGHTRLPSEGAFDFGGLDTIGSDSAISRAHTQHSGSSYPSNGSLDEAQVAAQGDYDHYDRRVFTPVDRSALSYAPMTRVVLSVRFFPGCHVGSVCFCWVVGATRYG